jgi:hypothetical protein
MEDGTRKGGKREMKVTKEGEGMKIRKRKA